MDTMHTMNNNLKDIHSHILYGIDDGSKTLEKSINMLEIAVHDGVSDIILTPHYIYESDYNCNNEEKKKRFAELQKVVKKKELPIRLYLGNEIMLCENIVKLLKKGECMSLNNSRYVLVELPMHNELLNAKNILFELLKNDYIPVLAHPERYTYLSSDLSFFKEIQEMGVLLQGNYKSLLGKYSKDAKKRLKKMLKNNMITFLASDMHHGESYDLEAAYKKVTKIVKNKTITHQLFVENFDYILYNKEIS